MTLTVHHLNNSRSQRVLFVLEELGIPYEIKRHRRDPKTMLAPPSLRQVHPLGNSPVVTDGALTLAETGAILEYLAAAGHRGAPARHHLPALRGGLSDAADAVVAGVRPTAAAGVERQFIGPQMALHLDYLERELAGRPWFAGDRFTIADAQMTFPIELAGLRLRKLGAARPRLQKWLDRVRLRPAYSRALERGGPYDLDLKPDPARWPRPASRRPRGRVSARPSPCPRRRRRAYRRSPVAAGSG